MLIIPLKFHVTNKKILSLIMMIIIWPVNQIYCWSLGNILRTSSQATLSSFETIWIGAQKGLNECSKQFQYDRWPCPESILSEVYQNHLPINREVAFVQAIISAGIVHTVAQNCSSGSLLENCKCYRSKTIIDNDDLNNRHQNNRKELKNNYRWGGCNDNIELGNRVAIAHLDDRETGHQDAKAKIRLHNHRVGRISVKETMIRKCKCHGVSGSCSMQTCWMKINNFHEIGNYLKKAYRKAIKFENNLPWESNNDNNFVNNNINDININNINNNNNKLETIPTWRLMYLNDSPDYCKPDINSTFGSYTGTLGRQCSMRKDNNKNNDNDNNNNNNDDDDEITIEERKSCRRLCKQCGYRIKRERRIIKTTCNCRFEFCCFVHCQQCQREEYIYVCVPSTSSTITTTTTNKTTKLSILTTKNTTRHIPT